MDKKLNTDLTENTDLTFSLIFFLKPKSVIRACLDFVWLLMSNSELLRIKNKQKTPYKKQKTASSKYKIQ